MNLILILLQTVIAVITGPSSGEVVAGTVSISGSAAGPQFARYEIAFAYDLNPTDTWFEIQPPSTSQVSDSLLAAWDTNGIIDGNYMIRLRVYSTDSATPVETIVRNIKVRNNAPTETPPPSVTAEPTLAPSPTTVVLGPTATLLPPPTATSLAPSFPDIPASLPPFLDLSTYTSAFCNGVYFTACAFTLLGIYAALRDRIRRPIRRWIRRIISDSKKP
ncbi:MAG: hypothetical protein FJ030_17120 [Chloroflexi bacterium]|nr:hypothetical protein [Chloroflexota bacterium]